MLQRVTEEELKRAHPRRGRASRSGTPPRPPATSPSAGASRSTSSTASSGWVETHIEQGRVLQDTGNRLGIVEAIAGYVHGDLRFTGRADHAGATPMDFRRRRADPGRRDDPRAGAAGERDRPRRGGDRRRGRDQPEPDQRRPRRHARLARPALGDRRAPRAARPHRRLRTRARRAPAASASSGPSASACRRQPLDRASSRALVAGAEATRRALPRDAVGCRPRHACASPTACPSAMVFVPCKDGLSHTPLEDASSADARARRRGRLCAIRGRVGLSAPPPLGRVGVWSPAFALAPAAELRAAAAETRRSATAGSGLPRASARASRSRPPRSCSRPRAASRSAPASRHLGARRGGLGDRGALADGGVPGALPARLGVSHRQQVDPRGHRYGKPVAHMRSYLAELDAAPYHPEPELPRIPRVSPPCAAR